MATTGTAPPHSSSDGVTPTLGQAHTRWTDAMDEALAEVLIEEVALRGKKPNNNGLKTISINRATEVVSEKCKVHVTALNVKNRNKLMKKQYVIARRAINQSGFGVVWDNENKYLDTDEDQWKEYCKDKTKDVERMRRKFFPMYDAMWSIYGYESGATGEGVFNTIDLEETENPPAETPPNVTGDDPTETVESQTEREVGSEREPPRTRKRKDPLGGMMESSVESLKMVSKSIDALRDGLKDNTIVDLAGKLWAALENTEGLTHNQKVATNGILGENPNSAMSFLSLPDPSKTVAVTILLRRHGLE